MTIPNEAGFCRFDFRPAPGVLISPVLISSTAIHDEVPMIVTDMPVESLVPYAEDGLNCGSAWKKDPVSGVIGVEQAV